MESSRSPYLKQLYVCINQRDPGVTCCAEGGSEPILEKLKEYVKAHGLKGKVRVSRSGCMDVCAQGPNVMVYPDYRWYSRVTLQDVDRIIQQELAPLVPEKHVHPSTGRPVRAFLFDLGNVLVRFDHMQAARKIVDGTGADAQALFQIFFESPLVVDHDEGRISTQEFYEGLRRETGLSLAYDRFLDVWNDIFTQDSEMARLIEDLLDRYPCYLISNTNRPHFEYLRRRCPVLNRMSGWILSYEVGCLKPNPVIYRRALELVRLPAEEILYIDDREDLISAAKHLGFQVHRFLEHKELWNNLEARGILPLNSARSASAV